MKCVKVQELFSSYLEDAVENPLRVAIDQHLAECPQCRARYERFRATVMLLEEMPEVEAPPGFHASVMARVEQARRAAPSRVKWWNLDWQSVFTVRVPARAAALTFAALLMMVLVVKLTALNHIVANIFGAPPAHNSIKSAEPRGPLPWRSKGHMDAKYADTELGLSIGITADTDSDLQTVYILRLETTSERPVKLEAKLLSDVASNEVVGAKHDLYSGSLTESKAVTVPLVVTRSASSRRAVAAEIRWRYLGVERLEYVFVPSEFDPMASSKRVSLEFTNASVFEIAREMSTNYGIVVMVSGDAADMVTSVSATDAAPAVMYRALRESGLTSRALTSSIYVIESDR